MGGRPPAAAARRGGRPVHGRPLSAIGLAPLARRQHWSKLINDLQPLTIDALEPAAADGLLSGLADRYRLELTPGGKAAALARLGWPIPYFMQLLVAELRDLPRPDADDIFEPGEGPWIEIEWREE